MNSLQVPLFRDVSRWLTLLTLLVSATGCMRPVPATAIPAPVGSCTLDLVGTGTDSDAIRAVLLAEGDMVVAQEIEALMALWAHGGHVIDAKNTAEDPDDDQTWRDKDAIRHRYVRTVFPGAPIAVQPADFAIVVEGTHATVRATTNIGDEVAPAGDRWELVKEGECWLIMRLTYNLESLK